MKKGFNLCDKMQDYTDGQIYFEMLLEEQRINALNPQMNSPLKISEGDSKEDIKKKLAIWKEAVNNDDN